MTEHEGRPDAAGAVPVRLTAEPLAELAVLLGLPVVPDVREQWVGATSTVLRWGPGLTVKVPHRDPAAVEACLRHARVSAAVARLGVACPEVLLTADLRPALDVPVVVSTFLPGAALEPGNVSAAVWRDVGAQLALLHAAPPAAVPGGLRRFSQTPDTDPAAMTERLLTAGAVVPEAASRLVALRDRLEAFVLPDAAHVFCHGDVHAGNVIADGGRLAGFVDFAGAGWLDAAWDFAAIPVGAVPAAVLGYAAAGGASATLRERIAWCRLQLALSRGLEAGGRAVDGAAIVRAAESLLARRPASPTDATSRPRPGGRKG